MDNAKEPQLFNYTYSVFFSEEDGEFVAVCNEFSGLSWLNKDPILAIQGIIQIVKEVVKDMNESGQQIPEPQKK